MYSTLVRFYLPSPDQISQTDPAAGESPAFYVCSLEKVNGQKRWIHQGIIYFLSIEFIFIYFLIYKIGKEPGVKLRTFQVIYK